MSLQSSADDVADAILDFELHIERAMAAYGRLTTTMSAARATAGVSVGYGQAMFEHLPQLGKNLVETRGEAGRLHRTAEAFARKLKITAGAPTNKDEPSFTDPETWPVARQTVEA